MLICPNGASRTPPPITTALAANKSSESPIDSKDCIIPSKVKQKWFGDIATFLDAELQVFLHILFHLKWLLDDSLGWANCCILQMRNTGLREVLFDCNAPALS